MQRIVPASPSKRRLLPAVAVGALLAALLLTQIPSVRAVALIPKTVVSVACTSADITGSPSSPQQPGHGNVTLTASSTGCTPQYRFLLQAPGSSTWVFKTGYTTSTTYTWNTTGAKVGIWQIGVWARIVGSTVKYQAFSIRTFTLDVPYCTATNIGASLASPQMPGASVTFTGIGYGCPEPYFEFWRLAPGSTWVMVRAYASGGAPGGPGGQNWVWDTTGAAPGAYRIGVRTRQLHSTHSYDSFALLTFWIVANLPVGGTVCVSANIDGGQQPQQAGGVVEITASSSGCSSPDYLFLLLAPGSSTWVAQTGYSAATIFNWTSTGAKQGIWQIGVWARQTGSTAKYQAYAIGTFTLIIPYCTAANITASPPSPQVANTIVTFTATGTNCTDPAFEFWQWDAGSSIWVMIKPYAFVIAGGDQYVAHLGGAGIYRFGVWARQSGSSRAYDSYAQASFWITP